MTISKINSTELKTLSLSDLYSKLDSSPKGLTTNEAISRSKELGYNQISGAKKQNIILKFLSYFKDPLILILIAASIISGLTGQIKNMAIILSMIFLSVTLNFYQEHKSSKAAEKISRRLAIKAKVLRDGKEQEIETK